MARDSGTRAGVIMIDEAPGRRRPAAARGGAASSRPPAPSRAGHARMRTNSATQRALVRAPASTKL